MAEIIAYSKQRRRQGAMADLFRGIENDEVYDRWGHIARDRRALEKISLGNDHIKKEQESDDEGTEK